jgi:prephenate dehydrogenase
MRLAILGAGNIGRTLGHAFTAAGHGFENFRAPRFGDDTASLLYACALADRPVLEQLISDVARKVLTD